MDVSACYEYLLNLFRYLSFPIEKYMPRKFQLMLLKTFSVPISWHHITYWVFWWCVLCPIPIERWWKRYHSVYFLSQTLVKWKQVSFHFIFIWWAQTLRNFPTLWHIISKLRLIVDMIMNKFFISFCFRLSSTQITYTGNGTSQRSEPSSPADICCKTLP